VLQLDLYQGHAGQLALADEFTFAVHDHPGAVQVQAGFGQHGFLQFHAGAGFDGIDKQAGDSGGDVGR
jgi:hypothetical protein